MSQRNAPRASIPRGFSIESCDDDYKCKTCQICQLYIKSLWKKLNKYLIYIIDTSEKQTCHSSQHNWRNQKTVSDTNFPHPQKTGPFIPSVGGSKTIPSFLTSMLDLWHMPISEISMTSSCLQFFSLLLYIYSRGVLKEYLRVRLKTVISPKESAPIRSLTRELCCRS